MSDKNNSEQNLEPEVNNEERNEVVDPWADLLFGRRRPRHENQEENAEDENNE